MRQVTTKFGAGASARVGPVLVRIVDPGLLVEVVRVRRRGAGGSEVVPLVRLDEVLADAGAVFVHEPEVVLSASMALLRGSAVPPRCLGVVLGNALALVVHDSEIELSTGVALLGVEPELEQGSGVVASLVGRHRLVEGLCHRRKRAQDRQQQCRDQGEEFSRPVRRAHVSSAPFEPRQPVDLLSAWYMTTHQGSVHVPRRQQRRGPITSFLRYRAKAPSEDESTGDGESNQSCPYTTCRGMS